MCPTRLTETPDPDGPDGFGGSDGPGGSEGSGSSGGPGSAAARPRSRHRRVDRRRRRSPARRLVPALAVLLGAGALLGSAWAVVSQKPPAPRTAPAPEAPVDRSADPGRASRSDDGPGRERAATPEKKKEKKKEKEEDRAHEPAPQKAATGPDDRERRSQRTSERSSERRSGTYQENGPGTYTWARGGGERAGDRGRLIRYGVKLEDGTGLTADAVAEEIDGILRDPRGWTRQGAASFQRVASPPYDMVVHVVSPGTTDKLCGQWGLETRGQVNCASAPDLIVNVRRWVELSDQYPNRPHDYHALIINHEVGHVLGHGHQGCPGAGRPAPAMMQQIKGVRGCRANPWVYEADGTRIDGPPAP
ncbi:DUF3152 domain-containing protein [Streptomyces sp. NPDC000594]|uniref:DUF3152 domain-containing protein n=1 Tax=Streptomyces sp. NPDC000594 TaxID=3154261 RepID=UPI003331C190